MKLRRKGKASSDESPARRRSGSDAPAERASASDLSNRYAFRRNRTLTGSSSPQIASSNELNAELRSPRAHVHHLTSLRRRLLMYFVVAGVASLGLYLLLTQLVATSTVQVADSSLLPVEDRAAYEKAINDYYAARPVERLRFLLNEPALLSHVQAFRPEVKTIKVEPGQQLGEASVGLTVREPIARWSIEGANQYVDDQGIVFMRNYYDDPGLQIVDNSGIQASSNKLVASNRFLGFVGRVVAGSAVSGLTVNKVTIPALTTRQVSLNLEGKPTEYKLSVDRSAGQQVEDIMRIDKYLVAHQLTPSYVDVRISGKAFYK